MKLGHIALIISLSLAACAAYFSIWGLSQLFAGGSTAVIIMASILELSKVVTTTILHNNWSKATKGFKIFLTSAVVVLMLITSAGIYGFLSNAYQSTSNKLELHEGELSVFENKKILFEKNIADNEKNVVIKNKRIEQLTDLRSRQEIRVDSAKTSKTRAQARLDIQTATEEIQKLSAEIDIINSKNAMLSDSVSTYNGKQLQLNIGSEIAGEVGPLKYISALTGAPMANIVNYLILLIIFVFDPLAIGLLLFSNRVLAMGVENNSDEVKTDATKEVLETIVEELNNIDVKEDNTSLTLKVDDNIAPLDITNSSGVVIDEMIEGVNEGVNEEANDVLNEESKLVSEKEIEVPVYKKEPVITTGKIELEDIKEIKENRGYSKPIPESKNNTIERIGSNKVIKNGDNNKFFFKRGR